MIGRPQWILWARVRRHLQAILLCLGINLAAIGGILRLAWSLLPWWQKAPLVLAWTLAAIGLCLLGIRWVYA